MHVAMSRQSPNRRRGLSSHIPQSDEDQNEDEDQEDAPPALPSSPEHNYADVGGEESSWSAPEFSSGGGITNPGRERGHRYGRSVKHVVGGVGFGGMVGIFGGGPGGEMDDVAGGDGDSDGEGSASAEEEADHDLDSDADRGSDADGQDCGETGKANAEESKEEKGSDPRRRGSKNGR